MNTTTSGLFRLPTDNTKQRWLLPFLCWLEDTRRTKIHSDERYVWSTHLVGLLHQKPRPTRLTNSRK